MNPIEKILTKRPYRSSEIVKQLIATEHISPEAARKRLSRSKGSIKRLDNLSLPNKELIYYQEGQFGTPEFANSIIQILIETNSAAGRALIGLQTVGGALPLNIFAKASATSLFPNNRKHRYFKDTIKQLTDLNLAHLTTSSFCNELVCLHGMEDIPSIQQATFIVEDILLAIIQKWLAKLGLGSYNKIKIREENPKYGQFAWDIVGPSYINGIVTFKAGKVQNGFIVGDISLNKEMTLERLKPFFYKLDSLNNQKNIRPFNVLMIADSYEKIALKKLRQRGVLIASPKILLGQENAELLKSLIGTIDNATKTVKENPDKFFNIVKKLHKIEGASLNLRSVVLDFIIARLFSIIGFECEIRRKIQTSLGERAEIDVVASRPDSIIYIEGKAVSSGNKVTKNEIKAWIDKSYPRICKWIKESEEHNKAKQIEFYSSTEYEPDAYELIDKIKEKQRKIPIKFREGKYIIGKLRELNQSSLVDIYKEQFV